MKKRVLITGVSGFAGSHLLDLLLSRAQIYELYGIVRERSSLDNIRHNLNSIKLLNCDLVNLGTVISFIKQVKPDCIYHLAGVSSVKLSWEGSLSMVNNNVVATLNVLEALRVAKYKETRILLACSSEEYGVVSEELVPMAFRKPL
jgi:GDP-4-dehydro-6-deoxy-D-mannose reductase